MDAKTLKSQMGQENLTILHASVNLPNVNAHDSFIGSRIKDSVFFSINEVSCKQSKLPMQIPDVSFFSQTMRAMDIRKTDTIVCYDMIGMLAAPRASWMLRTFGAKNVYVLDGTVEQWQEEKLPMLSD